MPGRWQHRGGECPRGVRPRRIRRFVEPALLLLLHHTPTHGYALAERMQELGLDADPVDISAIYRVLNSLEAEGMLVSSQDVAQSAGPPRRVYTLTEEGDRYLRAWVEDLRETAALLQRFIDAYEAHREAHDTGPEDGRADGA